MLATATGTTRQTPRARTSARSGNPASPPSSSARSSTTGASWKNCGNWVTLARSCRSIRLRSRDRSRRTVIDDITPLRSKAAWLRVTAVTALSGGRSLENASMFFADFSATLDPRHLSGHPRSARRRVPGFAGSRLPGASPSFALEAGPRSAIRFCTALHKRAETCGQHRWPARCNYGTASPSGGKTQMSITALRQAAFGARRLYTVGSGSEGKRTEKGSSDAQADRAAREQPGGPSSPTGRPRSTPPRTSSAARLQPRQALDFQKGGQRRRGRLAIASAPLSSLFYFREGRESRLLPPGG